MMDRTAPVRLDIIIPVFNEAEVIGLTITKLVDDFSPQNLRENGIRDAHFIFIDDGSTDSTANIIASRIRAGLPATLVRLSRNFGHQNAVTAGLATATADVVGIIDADLQDPPAALLGMLKVWRGGFDVVYGERKKRKESLFKVACYWAYYRILAFLSEVPVALDSGDFCLLDMRVVSALQALPEKLRFPRGLRAWVGFRQAAFPYERAAREAGESKYSLQKLYYLATDGIASLSIRPLKITQLFSIVFLLLSLALASISLSKWLTLSRDNPVSLWFLATFVLISFGHFVTLLCIYVMSAYIGRTYLEVKARPTYIVLETVRPGPPAE